MLNAISRLSCLLDQAVKAWCGEGRVRLKTKVPALTNLCGLGPAFQEFEPARPTPSIIGGRPTKGHRL
jgi:hypothetical protein